MRVLNLVTNDRARFFRQQVSVLNSRGIDYTTLTVPGQRQYDDGNTSSRPASAYARFVPTVLRHSFGDYDLVHANYGLTAPHAVLQPNLPVVVSLWGSDLMGEYGWLSKFCGQFADAVVVMSEAMAEELDRDCWVIPHGVDLDRFQPRPPEEARAELGWRDDAYHVLFPYYTERDVKNFPRSERVVEAARERVDEDVELQTVTGVAHEDMPTYMNAADSLLLTSRSEGSPNAVKEALACNLPVVSTPVGDVAERIDGVTQSRVCATDEGLVDALVTALETEGRSNGREAAREVSVARTSERLEALYREVTGAN
ncbi:glycosyltransferase family 4 protein [Halobacterium wangiae]|uniref:glycosyltransferase family 4 protein n=1 Tax=Halobacterium wangiae TaxID=2902623 RepID=UPI001E3F2420|nr:glycosyltransferase family 4 protein [Halobacterium wangiae]